MYAYKPCPKCKGTNVLCLNCEGTGKVIVGYEPSNNLKDLAKTLNDLAREAGIMEDLSTQFLSYL